MVFDGEILPGCSGITVVVNPVGWTRPAAASGGE
jgi:hypothetical protein